MSSVLLGQIIHYRLSPKDAETVNSTRTSHVGNSAYAGEVVPLLITKVDPEIPPKFEDDPLARPLTISGQAFLDGNFHHLWIQRVSEGEEDGTWTTDWKGPEVVEVAPVKEYDPYPGERGIAGGNVYYPPLPPSMLVTKTVVPSDVPETVTSFPSSTTKTKTTL